MTWPVDSWRCRLHGIFLVRAQCLVERNVQALWSRIPSVSCCGAAEAREESSSAELVRPGENTLEFIPVDVRESSLVPYMILARLSCGITSSVQFQKPNWYLTIVRPVGSEKGTARRKVARW